MAEKKWYVSKVRFCGVWQITAATVANINKQEADRPLTRLAELSVIQCFNSRQHIAGEKLERRSAAGRNVRDLVIESCLIHC